MALYKGVNAFLKDLIIYAAGLGKEVIHLCKKETFGNDGHFDVKQKATILWETPDQLTDLLEKRIRATII